MRLRIESEKVLVHKFREAVEIIENLRKFQKLWEEQYGVPLKEKKKRWEAKADQFLKDLGDTPGIIIKS